MHSGTGQRSVQLTYDPTGNCVDNCIILDSYQDLLKNNLGLFKGTCMEFYISCSIVQVNLEKNGAEVSLTRCDERKKNHQLLVQNSRQITHQAALFVVY